MEIVKVINLDNKITLKIESFNKNVFFYFNNKKKVVLKFTFNGGFFLRTGTLTVLNKLNYSCYIDYIKFITKNLESFLYNQYSHFSKLHMIGLGFKNFILGKQLYTCRWL